MTMRKALLAAAATITVHSVQAEPASTLAEFKIEVAKAVKAQQELARELAPVKSRKDFEQLMQQDNAAAHAFARMGAENQATFVQRLTFNEKGLTGFNFKVVEDSLTVREAYQLLSVFGIQHVVRSLKGLRVESRTDVMIKDALKALEMVSSDED